MNHWSKNIWEWRIIILKRFRFHPRSLTSFEGPASLSWEQKLRYLMILKRSTINYRDYLRILFSIPVLPRSTKFQS